MGVVTEAIKVLPNRHQQNVNCDFREYMPVLSEGEHYSNMLNSEELLDISLINDFKLSILNNRGVMVAEDIATFTVYDDDGNGNGRFRWDIASFPVLQEGKVRIVIYEDVQNKLYYASNLHRVINDSRKLQDRTAYFKYRHPKDIYYFGYETLPDFFIRERLHINATLYQQTFNVEEYEEVSTGLSQNPRFDVDLPVEIETENYDLEAHKAFATFLAHKSKDINNRTYVLAASSKYETDGDVNSYLKNGKVVLLQQDFSTINKQ